MDYRKEEMKKRKCFKGLNKKIEEKQGMIYFIIFIFMLAIIPASSKSLAEFILMIELETLSNTFRYIFTFVSIIAFLKMLINNIKNNKEVK
jgi:Na+-translocating ferredoxin:NAD+ oxidoreductase RnfA subunit